jgi:hypothetical protein
MVDDALRKGAHKKLFIGYVNSGGNNNQIGIHFIGFFQYIFGHISIVAVTYGEIYGGITQFGV